MKITDPDIIKRGEQDLMNAIREKLDWEIIEGLNREKLNPGNLECKNGDIVVHENKVAYKMDFEIKIGFSVLFDREGNIIPANGSSVPEKEPIRESAPEIMEPEESAVIEFNEDDISDEAIADIEKELTDIDAFHKEADDILASLGADAEIGIPQKIDMETKAEFNEPDLDDADLFEDLELPSDEELGMPEELTSDNTDALKDALAKSKEFWLPKDETPQKQAQVIDMPEKDELKSAFAKSQNFWLQK
ncbi:MAG: hypothetical protein KJ737_13595 [Proteobacteria bacterium]|nr:hypothetical protein [Pseudomonadota bacterium]